MKKRRTTRTGASDSGPTANDRGTGPATSASPAHSAPENGEPIDESNAAEFEIEIEFRRRLMGLRVLPKRERAQALRAAKDWRRVALKALREKRMRDRHASYILRHKMRMSAPRPQ
jgi:hypothetical protein